MEAPKMSLSGFEWWTIEMIVSKLVFQIWGNLGDFQLGGAMRQPTGNGEPATSSQSS